MRRYGERFKARALSRLVGPSRVSAMALSRELGVSQPTLSRWLHEARNVGPVDSEREKKPERGPESWSPREKLEAVLEAARLSDVELGSWLRRRGLTEEHLRQWRGTLEERVDAVFSPPKPERQSPGSRKRERELERELRRKDKALAETAALLVLRGKLDALWAGEDVTTRQTSDEPSSKQSTKRNRRERE